MVSVITICLNCENCIEETMKSVLLQKDADIEYIIKDGGSTDGTNEKIDRCAKSITNERIHVRHITEKDDGIYDAMNRAAALATGSQIIFMNAGDRFYDENVVRNASLYFEEKADVYFGNTLYVMKLCCFPQLHYADRKNGRISVGHQSCFYSADTLKEYRFDTSFRIAGDHEQLRRIFFDDKSFLHMNLFISVCDREGISNRRSTRHFDEVYMIEHGGELIKDGKYYGKLITWKLKAAVARLLPMLENKRYCLNNLKRNRYLLSEESLFKHHA